jgi:type I restriction enzyme, R subunit
VEDEVLSSVAARLARLDKDLSPDDHAKVAEASGGLSLKDLANGIVQALNVDEDTPPLEAEARKVQAAKPFASPALRQLILQLRQKADQVVDIVTQDTLLHAGFSEAATERAQGLVQSFEAFIAQHKDEITALQILYSRPSRAPLSFQDIKALADALHAPPHLLDESQLWQAYAALNKTKVKGTSQRRLLTDLVSLVRFAMQQDNELVPYPERVQSNYKAWLAQQQHSFTAEQLQWLEMIRDHIAANLRVETEDFEYAPFNSEGGLGKVHQLFGAELGRVIEAMNRELVA